MINFTPLEFRLIYDQLSDEITTKWNAGKDRKYTENPKDVLFMTLTVLKHVGTLGFPGEKMFHINGTKFGRLITGFMKVIVEPDHNEWVKKTSIMYTR